MWQWLSPGACASPGAVMVVLAPVKVVGGNTLDMLFGLVCVDVTEGGQEGGVVGCVVDGEGDGVDL